MFRLLYLGHHNPAQQGRLSGEHGGTQEERILSRIQGTPPPGQCAVENINRNARTYDSPSASAQLREHMKGFRVGIKGMAFSNFTSYGAGLRNRFDASMGMHRV